MADLEALAEHHRRTHPADGPGPGRVRTAAAERPLSASGARPGQLAAKRLVASPPRLHPTLTTATRPLVVERAAQSQTTSSLGGARKVMPEM